MAAIDNLMRVVDEIVSASSQLSTAHRNGESWEQQTDDRKHYAARWCALRDMLQNLLNDRTELEYEATMLMTAMTDVLHHFTKTPSTLADTEVRCMGHAANARMLRKLREHLTQEQRSKGAKMFDEQPDGDPHGECALEIKTLQARIAELEAERDALKVERDEWAEKWHAMRRQYGEMRWPGMTRVVTASDAAMNQPKESGQ